MKKKKIYSTQLDWLRIITATAVGVAVVVLWHLNIETRHLTNLPLLFATRLFIVLLLLAVGSIRHVLYEECFITYILFFPAIYVRWEDINNAIFVPRTVGYKQAYSDRIFLLKGVSGSNISSPVQALEYLQHCPRQVIQINVPRNKRVEYIAMFEKCLGFRVIINPSSENQ